MCSIVFVFCISQYKNYWHPPREVILNVFPSCKISKNVPVVTIVVPKGNDTD